VRLWDLPLRCAPGEGVPSAEGCWTVVRSVSRESIDSKRLRGVVSLDS
jgi:hypothetical protein